MNRLWTCPVVFGLLSLLARSGTCQDPPVTVYFEGSQIVEPQLQAPDLSALSIGKCKHKLDGKVMLSLVIDASGQPRNITFLVPLANDLDRAAIRVASMDRFTPATRDGVAVALGRALELTLRGCVEETKDSKGSKVQTLRFAGVDEQKLLTLAGIPEQIPLAPADIVSSTSGDESPKPDMHVRKVGAGVKAPELVRSVNARFSEEARRKKFSGTCVLSVIVDAHGLPQNVHVVRTLGLGLDQNAIDAVDMYRFKPAKTLEGEPVPVSVSVEVRFRLY